MSLKVPKANNVQLFKEGYKHLQGLEDAVLRNIQAVAELTDLVRTSFGPNGRNKLIVNHLGKLFVTSDAATIIREIEIVHPAAKLLVMASQAQEAEMGDATNLLVILAGQLLKESEHLLIMGLHPSEVTQGYELAGKKALEQLETLSTFSLPSPLTNVSLASAIKPAIASKHYGAEDVLASLVADAALIVMPPNPKHFNVDNVRVVKIMGGSLAASRVVRGMVFNREPEGNVKRVTRAKVAVFTSGIDIAQTETKGTVLLHNAEEMLNFTRGEEKLLEKVFKEIADTGVKVLIAGSTVGELAMHYLDRHGIAVLKVLSKFDLRRLCRAVNATPLARMGPPTPEEAGYVDVFEVTEIGGDRVTVLRQLADDEVLPEDTDATTSGPDASASALSSTTTSVPRREKTHTATIVLRGATTNALDDLQRAVDDGVNLLKALLRDPRLVPGAGATELELARRVEAYGASLKDLSQHAVKRFAAALEVVPRTLAENTFGGAEGNEVLSALWAAHHANPPAGMAIGVNVEAETGNADATIDVTKVGILDSLAAKSWAIRLATEAAVQVLSVDSIIMSRPAGGPKVPQQASNWDED